MPLEQRCPEFWRKNVKPFNELPVMLPNKKQLHALQQGLLNLSLQLSTTARTATILPHLQSASLISLGKLCDDKCTIALTKKK